MNIEERIIKTIEELQQSSILFAIVGGLAARHYRNDLRDTKDVDFAIDGHKNPSQLAKDFVTNVGLSARVARKADLEGGPLFAIKNKSTPEYIICGEKEGEIGLDFLLPAMPWVPNAVLRAQKNIIDIGYGPMPVITVEDLLIAKLVAVASKAREKDLDDLKTIFRVQSTIDYAYLETQMKSLKLEVSLAAAVVVTKELLQISKSINKDKKRENKERFR